MSIWNVIQDTEDGKLVESEGRYRVYEKTDDGSNRIGVYDNEEKAVDVWQELHNE